MANIKKISQLEQMQSLSDSANVLIEEKGAAMRFAAKGLEKTANRVTTIDEDSDDAHYPTAKAVRNYVTEVGSAEPKEQWKNLLFGFIGDSQTEANSHKTKLWCKHITDKFTIFSYYAYSGFTIAKNDASYGTFIEAAKKLSKAVDVIFVMGGVNDVWFNTPMGEFGSTDNTTFYGAMEELCTTLMEKNPNCTIIFITPTEQSNASCTAANTTGHTATDFAQAMKKVCAKYAIPVFDANALSGIYPKNAANAAVYTTDNLHLNDAGQERLGKQVAAFVENCYIPEGKGFLTDTIGGADLAYYNNACMTVSFTSANYGGVMLPGVTKISLDMSLYTVPFNNYQGGAPGWFGFKQSDGSYKAFSPYNGLRKEGEGLDKLRGEIWDFDTNVENPTNHLTNLWATPAAMPEKIEVVLEGETARVYFDSTEVYSAPCVELGFITTYYFCDYDGVTFAYGEDSEK